MQKIYNKCLHSLDHDNVELYKFMINDKESDPDSKITYLDNIRFYSPAYMDFENEEFNYGSWKDAFFMQVKPCVLGYDGVVQYYLNPNDYSKKLDNDEDSNINDESCPGNVMIEFPKIYWKIKDNGDGTSTVSICNVPLNDEFKCWSNLDMNGDEIDHFYISAYDGSLVDDKLRSLSDKEPLDENTRQQECDYAEANNQDENNIWYTWVMCDLQLLRLLLTLISKSTNSQEKFGYGNNRSGNDATNTGVKNSGTLDDKGLFYGSKDSVTCVKVFGIENFWGNMYKNVAGWIVDHGTQKIKMTYSRSDGSEVDGYNFNGDGYITIEDATPSGGNVASYITKAKITPFGLIPYESSGTAKTHYCDGFWFDNSRLNYAFVGGYAVVGNLDGAFCTNLGYPDTAAAWTVGAALSCKPLAIKGDEGDD